MKNILICGAGGFIGTHLISDLKAKGHRVVGVDLKHPEFSETDASEFLLRDLGDERAVANLFKIQPRFDEVYQLAADMGGAGYIFTGGHDANIMRNSALVNLNIAKWAIKSKVGKLLYTSSACIYPSTIQDEPNNPGLQEWMAYPANPDSDYGFEKLFSERLYLACHRNFGLNLRISRLHNIFGPHGSYDNGKEKAPAAICRKVASAPDSGEIEIWGDGEQTRSFLYIADCLNGMAALMESTFMGPVNIGSEEQVSINQLAEIAISLSGKRLRIKHLTDEATMKKQGVRGRNSHNKLMKEKTNWEPIISLKEGMANTYEWIKRRVKHGQSI